MCMLVVPLMWSSITQYEDDREDTEYEDTECEEMTEYKILSVKTLEYEDDWV